MRGKNRWSKLPAILLLTFAILGSTPGKARPYSSPSVRKVILKNGTIVLLREEPASEMVAIEVCFSVGVIDEKENEVGTRNLIARLLQRSIGAASPRASGPDILESAGTILATAITPDYVELSFLTTNKAYCQVLHLLSGLLRIHKFSTPDFDEEKGKIVEELRGERSAFRSIYEIFLQSFYRYHPYRSPQGGSAGTIARLTKEETERFFNRYFVPNRLAISLAGDINEDEALQAIREKFESIKPVGSQILEIQWEPKAQEKEIFLSTGSQMAWIFLGFPAPSIKSPDYPAMKVLYSLLGEGISCRLWSELREKRGLAYELGCIYPVLQGPAHLLIYVITPPERVRECRRTIFQEINKVREKLVPDSELEDTRKKVIGAYLLGNETCRDLASHAALDELLGVGYSPDASFMRKVEAITREDLREVARKYLENPTLIVAKPGLDFFDYFP